VCVSVRLSTDKRTDTHTDAIKRIIVPATRSIIPGSRLLPAIFLHINVHLCQIFCENSSRNIWVILDRTDKQKTWLVSLLQKLLNLFLLIVTCKFMLLLNMRILNLKWFWLHSYEMLHMYELQQPTQTIEWINNDS